MSGLLPISCKDTLNRHRVRMAAKKESSLQKWSIQRNKAFGFEAERSPG